GTTDITRCLHFGSPTKIQRYHYTLVLKGHLALRHTQFPFGTCGEHLNALAHHPLWQAGMDFGHGTGHGVGCYLCVHEGPQRISSGNSQVPLEVGMVVSNEPGVYLQDQYGIRIENCCVVVKVLEPADSLTGHGPFLGFKDLTMVPYARNLIDHDILSRIEREWINQYHNEIFELLCDDLAVPEREWLANATKPLVS
ncbi:MAG: M24 family metallopeptidase, partial [Gammaproteobacteria bacterium]|nr:M24 family metallopeptidase [Gammaproteobacteria bacterium]